MIYLRDGIPLAKCIFRGGMKSVILNILCTSHGFGPGIDIRYFTDNYLKNIQSFQDNDLIPSVHFQIHPISNFNSCMSRIMNLSSDERMDLSKSFFPVGARKVHYGKIVLQKIERGKGSQNYQNITPQMRGHCMSFVSLYVCKLW